MVLLQRNVSVAYDKTWLEKRQFSLRAINDQAAIYKHLNGLEKNYEIGFLLKAITLIDLTTLGGDDTNSNVKRLCYKSSSPLNADVLHHLSFLTSITTAAVCVYPSRVSDAVKALKTLNILPKIQIASVATGFPSGQYALKTRLLEVKNAIEKGATEVDIVINRTLVLTGEWEELYNEIKEMRNICDSNVHIKAILAVGELESMDKIYKAAMVAMMAGVDFIKTSTGKETINATLPIGIVMCRAIRDYYNQTGIMVGLKPAGGIKTYKDIIAWLTLVKEELDNTWLVPQYFRIGASSVLGDVEKRIFYLVNQCNPESFDFLLS